MPHCLPNKKLSYRRGTMRCAMSVKTVLNVAQMIIELHFISPALGEIASYLSKVADFNPPHLHLVPP